tara:strand:- start:41577 stop:42191 length:615 start_codon:yes stop_codon:yes gene_type:complete
MAVIATLIAMPAGVFLAWCMARYSFPGRSALETFITLPLVLPPVATGLILLTLFSPSGPLGRFLGLLNIEIVFTWKAVVIAMTVMGFPLLVRTARTGFEQVEPRYEQIAATLGAGTFRVFFTVSLPLAWRAVLAGAMLAFSRALGEFGATMMIAGALPSTRTMSVALYSYTQIGDQRATIGLLVTAIAIAFVAMLISNRLTVPS